MDRQSLRHVAIIMDGNGRWAQARGLARVREVTTVSATREGSTRFRGAFLNLDPTTRYP